MEEGNAPSWHLFLLAGVILLFNTIFFKISVSGPWNSTSFTLGVQGLMGLMFTYISWYRFSFKRKGLVPWLDLWNEPKSSAQKELFIAILFLILAYLLGINNLSLPVPTSLILSLIGLLMLIQSVYVLLSVTILSDD
tara:strand:+ start:1892 stop:2302 length:411 start_codon:yes stop_codon:yes gene_type:complete